MADPMRTWSLRDAGCFAELPPPNFSQTLNTDVSAELARSTLMYWIMRLIIFGQILAAVVHQNS